MSQENILDLSLEEVIGDRFGRYSKYIIQDRALPDARDGLKPVQRRILYAMHVDKNTYDKGFRKAAKTVGTVIGNYHPHGDSSVYDAMVRLSQDWKLPNVLIEMHGNNGSIDGDPPAAMRYTETRLARVSEELLRDIDKETVDFIYNFDETTTEPVVLPAKFPNLLVNGSTGISAGYATDIPPHNLQEVIDAVIKQIDKPDVTVDELLKIVKGPDFPTGGIMQGIDEIKKAYETGRGKVVVRGKAKIEQIRGNREKIVIEEIPYEVNKAMMVKKMDELRIDRKVEGIAEVRDESDRTGLRIVVELRKDADAEGILHYFYKNTDLQVTYNFNMVAIQDRTPKLMSLKAILKAFIDHQKEVVTRQVTFDLNKANKRQHIIEGLIKAISVLDEVIQLIRASKDKGDAKNRLIKQYEFSEEQAEAIVNLQLYRLTNTDVTQLQKESAELAKNIETYEAILSSDSKLMKIIKKDLRDVKKTFGMPRKTAVEAEVEELKINIEVTIASEDVVVSVTKDGYIKRTSLRSYGASKVDDLMMKDLDYLIGLFEINTTEDILLFTNKGRYIFFPVHELPDIRWKDLGAHLSHFTSLEEDEKIIQALPVKEYGEKQYLTFFTKSGMVKRSELALYKTQRFGRAIMAMNLRDDDELIDVYETTGNCDLFVASNTGYGLWYHESEVNITGVRTVGVKAITLKESEHIVSGQAFDDLEEPALVVVTQRGAVKRMQLRSFDKMTRAKRGLKMLRELKSKPHEIIGFFTIEESDRIILRTDQDEIQSLYPLDLSVSERTSNGSFVIDSDHDGEVIEVWKQAEYKKVFESDEDINQ